MGYKAVYSRVMQGLGVQSFIDPKRFGRTKEAAFLKYLQKHGKKATPEELATEIRKHEEAILRVSTPEEKADYLERKEKKQQAITEKEKRILSAYGATKLKYVGDKVSQLLINGQWKSIKEMPIPTGVDKSWIVSSSIEKTKIEQAAMRQGYAYMAGVSKKAAKDGSTAIVSSVNANTIITNKNNNSVVSNGRGSGIDSRYRGWFTSGDKATLDIASATNIN